MDSPTEAYADWKGWTEEGFAALSPMDDQYFTREIARFHFIPGKRILEIGFGNGNFAGWAAKNRYLYTGVEVNPLLAERAKAKGFKIHSSIFDPDMIIGFNIVFAFDVLEHVTDLPGMFVRIAEVLKPGAFFIARFPNGDSPFGRIYQNGDLTHVNAIGLYKVRQLAHLAELDIRYIGTPARTFGGRLAFLKRAITALLRWAIEYPLRKLYYRGERISFDPNYLIVLQKSAPQMASVQTK